MKIGILTYHRTNNYGACLQAVATRFVLEQMGHEVFYVDYWPSYHANLYKVFSIGILKSMNLRGKVVYLLGAFKGIKQKKERIQNFNLFLNEFVIPYCRPMSMHYDVLLYGSDQIWRKQSALRAYNPIYFAEKRCLADKHIAFSASMGELPKKDCDKETVKKLIANFDHIAVREDNLKNLLNSFGYNGVKRVLDPTLLLTKEEWIKRLNIEKIVEKPYLLVYYVTSPAFDMYAIRKFAKLHNLDVKILCGNANNDKIEGMISTADPKLFLSLFMNASYTFVTSFHGLAFSIIFEREFYASFYSNSDRAKTLLRIVGLESRLLPPKNAIVEQTLIDYECVRKKLNIARIESVKILNSFL